MTPAELVGLLAEPDRLRVLSAVVLGAQDSVARAVGTALVRLEAGGVVEREHGAFRVRPEVFKDAARAAAPPGPADDLGYADASVEQVVGRFVRDGRLLSFPAQGTKRRLVLEHVAATFEPGRRYPEREVDAVLRAWTGDARPSGPDHATLRRYLVDHGLLARDRGEYWRSGGWVDA